MGFVKYKENGEWKTLRIPYNVDDVIAHALEQVEQRVTDVEAELDNINTYIALHGKKDGE